jgi:hypothetical protein
MKESGYLEDRIYTYVRTNHYYTRNSRERERERHDTSFLSHNIQNEAEIISEPEWT